MTNCEAINNPIYYVEYSAHGSNFVPDRTLLSFKEAYRSAVSWLYYADTVGGQARIINSTNSIVSWASFSHSDRQRAVA